MPVQPLYHATVERQCFRGAGVGCFRWVGFSPLQFCLTEKTLSCANEAPIWGRQLGPCHDHRQLEIESKGNAAQQERCEQVVIRSWSATYVEGVRPISREDLSGVIVTAGDN
jgi:hypothetical protein